MVTGGPAARNLEEKGCFYPPTVLTGDAMCFNVLAETQFVVFTEKVLSKIGTLFRKRYLDQ